MPALDKQSRSVAPTNRVVAEPIDSGMDLDWPLSGYIDDVRPVLADIMRRRRPAVLATLYAVEGGGPRPPGTQMIFAEGVSAGFFSGGCVEGDVALQAEAVLATGTPRRLTYGRGSPYADIRLLCGARIDILLERLIPDDPAVQRLLELTDARRTAVWCSDGSRRVCLPEAEVAALLPCLHAPPRPAAVGVRDDLFGVARRHEPRQRLVVVGGDPTALAIASLGAQSGMETVLVRPRGPDRAPPLDGVAYHREEPAHAFRQIGLDRWTAVAVATHELESDEDALVAALASRAGYVGVLGARTRIPERRARLKARGVGAEDLQRLRAPIGLPLGGKAPWAVAVSVIAEIQQLQAAGAFHG